MSTATAEQIRKRPIYVLLPGTDLRLECRRPEPLELIASGLLKLETFGSVIEQIAETLQTIQMTAALDNRPVDEPTKPQTFNDFLDLWCVAAVVAPKVVLAEEDAIYDPTALWVKDLDFDVKGEIFQKTMGVRRDCCWCVTPSWRWTSTWPSRPGCGRNGRPTCARSSMVRMPSSPPCCSC
jgi:hypothetical protein